MVECHTKDRPSMMRCSSSSSSSHSVSVVTLPPSLPPYSSFFGILGILCLFRLLLSFPQRLFLTISQRRTKERGRVTWSTVLLFFLLPPSHTKYRRRNFCSSFSSFWRLSPPGQCPLRLPRFTIYMCKIVESDSDFGPPPPPPPPLSDVSRPPPLSLFHETGTDRKTLLFLLLFPTSEIGKVEGKGDRRDWKKRGDKSFKLLTAEKEASPVPFLPLF